jgi:transposase
MPVAWVDTWLKWLVARGEDVADVPSTATARVRELSRGGRRKNDVIDAAAAASVAALSGDASPVVAEDLTTVLALLDERRGNVITQRTRLINQLHALLRDLVPGGAPTDLSAALAARLLTRVRPVGPVEATRKQLARDLVAEIRETDQRLKALTTQIAATIAEHGSRLLTVDGIGPVIAGRLLGRTRRASRFPSASAFANYAGVAPVEVASADRARHRLPRGGDRQLNLALHIIALTQVRVRGSRGRSYYDAKIAAGKTHNEAMRCLKRRLADHVWRLMIADERHLAAGPGGHSGPTLQSSAAGSTPTTSSSDKSLPGPANRDSTTPRSAA